MENASANNTVLVLGAAGRFGLATVRAFAAAGWSVKAHVRPARCQKDMPELNNVEWLAHDLEDLDGLIKQVGGADIVVHALSPAYCNIAWQQQSPKLLTQAIAVSRAFGATLMMPGNVYNFGADLPVVLREDTEQRATDTKGRVRIAMEKQLAEATQAGDLRAVVIRAGDFFGAGLGTWFDIALAKDLWKGRMVYPGKDDIEHAWAYLPDLAQTFVRVADRREQLPAFEVLHFAGHTVSGVQWREMLTGLARSARWLEHNQTLRTRSLPWGLMRLASLFVGTWCAVADMRHLWHRAHRLDGTRLAALIGQEPHTPLRAAARAAVAELYPHVFSGTGMSSGGFAGAMS